MFTTPRRGAGFSNNCFCRASLGASAVDGDAVVEIKVLTQSIKLLDDEPSSTDSIDDEEPSSSSSSGQERSVWIPSLLVVLVVAISFFHGCIASTENIIP
jgi:hypothetical protein